MIAVYSSYVERVDGGFFYGFEAERLPDSTAWQRGAEVPAELVLGFSYIYAGGVAEVGFVERAVAVHKSGGAGGGRLEFDEQRVVLPLDEPGYVEAVGGEHVVCSGDELAV